MNNKVRITITDDHDIVSLGLTALLTTEPTFEVVESFANGERSIREIPGINPNVAIVDINMPGMNGLETARHLREEMPDLKIILHSMEVKDSYIEEAKAIGVNAYVSKSSDITNLIGTIKHVLVHDDFRKVV